MLAQRNRFRLALIVAIFVYLIGIMGIFSPYYRWFIDGTPIIILITLGLIMYTHPVIDRKFLTFILLSFIIGVLAEVLFISNPKFFGNYQFGKSLGPLVRNVPWVIGVNWVVIIYCVGIFTQKMYTIIEKKIPPDNLLPKAVQKFSVVVDGAFIATFFDWVMEKAAIKMGYWSWEDIDIPFSNYVSWFIISAIMLFIFEWLPFRKDNHFAVHLFILQLLFYLTLRTFL